MTAMANVRAKFRCVSVKQTAYGTTKTYEFTPMYDVSIPEDQRFSTATPSGNLTMNVDNPAVDFELGAYYYLDFAKVAEAVAAA